MNTTEIYSFEPVKNLTGPKSSRSEMFIRRRQDVGDTSQPTRFRAPEALFPASFLGLEGLWYTRDHAAWTHGSLASNILSHSYNSIFKCGHPL